MKKDQIVKCPRCNHINKLEGKKCEHCGVIKSKYIEKRINDLQNTFKSLNCAQYNDIESSIRSLANKYPELQENLNDLLSYFNKAITEYEEGRLKNAKDYFHSLKEQHSFISEEADNWIRQIELEEEYKKKLEESIKAFNESRFTDAREILIKLKKDYPNHLEVNDYLDKLSRFIDVDIIESKNKATQELKCLKCGSSSITTVKQGYQAGTGCCSALLVGPLGLICGAVGQNRLYNVCQKCGYRWEIK